MTIAVLVMMIFLDKTVDDGSQAEADIFFTLTFVEI